MRVLNTSAHAVLLAGALALAGCYSPGVEDCQFACGAGDACPDGTSCMGGFCRSSTTGTCSSAADAPLACPALPANCTMAFTFPGGCGAVCNSGRDWVTAGLACSAPWKLAVLDTPAKLAAAPTTENYWVGAHRLSSSTPWVWVDGTAMRPDVWANGQIPPDGDGENCATLDKSRTALTNTTQCGDQQRFLCTTIP